MGRNLSKKLSNFMLIAAFLSTLFYSASYPYIYAETLKVVPRYFIGIETILACVGCFVFCCIWNKFSDKMFRGYRIIMWAEIVADSILFLDYFIRQDLKFYFLFNIIIYSVITRNLCCGGVKMRAKVNPTEKLRERYDNNSQIINSTATLIGAGIALVHPFQLNQLFVLALIGNIIDNFFYLYIYRKIKESRM